MSKKLDAVAYRNRDDYRINRLEHVAATDYMRKTDQWPNEEQQSLYYQYLEEICQEMYGDGENN